MFCALRFSPIEFPVHLSAKSTAPAPLDRRTCVSAMSVAPRHPRGGIATSKATKLG
jgi:hypothetical protein